MSATGAQLAHDRIDRYRSMGAFGKPVYQSHVQLRAMLLAQRKPQLANYFARPIHDPDLSELRWVAELPGSAQAASALPPEQLAAGSGRMAELHRELQVFVEELCSKGGNQPGGAAAFASVLEQARRVPASGEHLFFVGDQPVIAFWGFEDAQAGSVDPAEQWPQRLAAAAPPATAAPSAAPVAEPARAPRPAAVVPPPVGSTSDGGRPRWWRWLLGLLLLLALLALLAWLLPRACTPTPEPRPDELQIPPGALEKGDLAFLEGTWQLGDGPLGAYADRPDNRIGSDRHIMQFDAAGGGKALGRDRERRGMRVPDCEGELSARTDGKKLYIDRGDCIVPGTPKLHRLNGMKLECEIAANNATMCYIVNRDGHRWQAPIRRMQ